MIQLLKQAASADNRFDMSSNTFPNVSEAGPIITAGSDLLIHAHSDNRFMSQQLNPTRVNTLWYPIEMQPTLPGPSASPDIQPGRTMQSLQHQQPSITASQHLKGLTMLYNSINRAIFLFKLTPMIVACQCPCPQGGARAW